MAPRNNNRNNQRANRMPSKAVAPMAPAPVQQPRPTNTYGGTQRYITNLNPKGTNEYNAWVSKLGAGYDGGGWVSTTGTPGVTAATDDDLRAYAKAVALKGNTYDFGDMSGVRSAAAEFDAQQASQSQTAASATTPTAQNYRGIKSIKDGLKLGGDNILGRREAMKISRNSMGSYDDVIAKALGRGMSIGGGAVRQSNRAYQKSDQAMIDKTIGGLVDPGPLAEMRRVTPGKRQMFSGTYQLDGQTMPLIESRRGGAAGTLGGMGGGAGGGRRRGGGRRGKRGRGGAGDTGTTSMGTTTPTVEPMQPMAEAPMTEQGRVEINMPSVGEDLSNWATGFRTRRSSRKRAGSMAQGLASQRVNPTGSWRYGV